MAAAAVADGGPALFEANLDGARVQIHRRGDAVSVFTRSLDDVTARLPEVVDATLALPVTDLIADAEAIALRPDGRPHRFQVTASRFGHRRLRDAGQDVQGHDRRDAGLADPAVPGTRRRSGAGRDIRSKSHRRLRREGAA